MKTSLTMLLAALFSAPVIAQAELSPLSGLQNPAGILNFKIYRPDTIAPQSAPDQAKPIRMGSLKVQISKTTVIQLNDGSYQFKREKVCSVEAPVPVFDLTNKKEWAIEPNYTVCKSTLDGKHVEVRTTGAIILSKDNLFSGEEEAPFKWAGSYMEIGDHNDWKNLDVQPVTVATREVGLKSLIGILSPGRIMSCSQDECEVYQKEFFSAVVEFKD